MASHVKYIGKRPVKKSPSSSQDSIARNNSVEPGNRSAHDPGVREILPLGSLSPSSDFLEYSTPSQSGSNSSLSTVSQVSSTSASPDTGRAPVNITQDYTTRVPLAGRGSEPRIILSGSVTSPLALSPHNVLSLREGTVRGTSLSNGASTAANFSGETNTRGSTGRTAESLLSPTTAPTRSLSNIPAMVMCSDGISRPLQPRLNHRVTIILDLGGVLIDREREPGTIYYYAGADDFVRRLLDEYNVAIWSSMMHKNASPIISRVFGARSKELVFTWFRDRCMLVPLTAHSYDIVKPLSTVFSCATFVDWTQDSQPMYNLTNTIMIDDSITKMHCNRPENFIVPLRRVDGNGYTYPDYKLLLEHITATVAALPPVNDSTFDPLRITY